MEGYGEINEAYLKLPIFHVQAKYCIVTLKGNFFIILKLPLPIETYFCIVRQTEQISTLGKIFSVGSFSNYLVLRLYIYNINKDVNK